MIAILNQTLQSVYTNSLVNTDSFYANLSNKNFQKILTFQLTSIMNQKFFHYFIISWAIVITLT